ncbi:hypothetical protein [Roseisolibacter sp. H3M3-2]|uniref:hypothetical protein n=1 Tax=Roseisolibacter sp. H3M3-2 TaxID=3031323 RepID=UPI0023DB415D|nr:hypothetical protein [Roseisolibacter sp. H3M3-2]MDF1503964.1 hypothetical protein [Roseisolibacter sp. H3M3-2]
MWGDRGGDARAGVLRWGALAGDGGALALRVLDTVRAAWPTAPELRHVSVLALVGDTVLVASASDGGGRGPFAPAGTVIGTLTVAGGAPSLRRAPPTAPLVRLDDRKAEAVAPLGGGALAIGTDDERLGGMLLRVGPRGGAARRAVAAAEGGCRSFARGGGPRRPAHGGRAPLYRCCVPTDRPLPSPCAASSPPCSSPPPRRRSSRSPSARTRRPRPTRRAWPRCRR